VSQITRSRLGGPALVIVKVTRRDDPKRSDSGERAAFGSPQLVFAAARIVDDLSVRSARQVEVGHEHLAWIEIQISIARLATTLDGARIILAVPRSFFSVGVSRTSGTRTTAQRERIFVITPAVVSRVPHIAPTCVV
jgi:hypothetical protein